jgi:hypothetical protein
MKHAGIFLLLVLSSLLSLAQSSVTASAPVINFKLPVLNEQGMRTSMLRGSEAHYINDTQIDLVGMQYTTFVEDGTNAVDTTLLAPVASVFIVNNKVKVHGDEGVRLIRQDIDVTGEKWTYDHDQKKILIERNVRVIFCIELKDILK